MREELDSFPFRLALRLGKTLGEIDAMPYPEYLQWLGYFEAHDAMAELESRGS